MKMRTVLTAGIAALAAALAGCSSSGNDNSGGGGGSGGQYHVIVMGGLSAQGVLADNASTSVNAARAGADYVNDHGGVLGKKVVVKVIDAQADPTTAVTKLRAAIAEQKPDVVIDSGPSNVAAAILPILNQNKILSFNMGPTADSADPSKFPLNFDVAVGAAEQLKAYVPYFQDKGYKSVAILHGNSAYGVTYGKSAADVLSKAGIKVTANEQYDVTSLDMTPQLQKIQSSKPDAMVLDAYGAPLGYVLKGVSKLGMDTPIIGNTSVSATNLTGLKPPDGLVGTPEVKNLVMEVLSSVKYDASATKVNDAVQRMLKYGPIKASLVLAPTYDALPLVAAAAKAANSTDAAKIAKSLEDPNVTKSADTTMLSPYTFSSTNHAPTEASTNYTFIAPSPIKNGQFQ